MFHRYPKNAPRRALGPTIGESSTAALQAALDSLPGAPYRRTLRAIRAEIIRRHCSKRGKARKRWAMAREAEILLGAARAQGGKSANG